jgi:hypothetical protein
MPASPARRDGKLVKKSAFSRGTPSITMLVNSAARQQDARPSGQHTEHGEQGVPALVRTDQRTQVSARAPDALRPSIDLPVRRRSQ